jgi:peptidoglycan hydrolase CwlO-like protein
VNVAQGDLSEARQAYDMQAEILGVRASSMYRDGSLAGIEILLDSKSVSDFMSRVKFLNTIGLRDADIVASLKGQQDLLEQQVDQLKNTQAVAESLEFELKARKIEIMLRIQERQDMVNKAQGDIVALLDSEASRRRTEQGSLLRAVLQARARRVSSSSRAAR